MASFIPAPVDPLAQALGLLGQNLGQQFGQNTIGPLLGIQSPAQTQQNDVQKFMQFLQFQQAPPEQREAMTEQAFSSGAPLPFGAQRQGETGQVPQFQTPAVQNAFLQTLLGQQQTPLQQAQTQTSRLAGQESAFDLEQKRRITRGDLTPSERKDQRLKRKLLKSQIRKNRPSAKTLAQMEASLVAKGKSLFRDEVDPNTGRSMQRHVITGELKHGPAETKITTNVNTRDLTEGQIQRFAAKKGIIAAGDSVRDLWLKGYTGPMDGIATWIKNRLGGGTKNSAKFEAGVAGLLETMYNKAGKQLSDTELAKWKPTLPSLFDPDKTFDGKLEALVENVSTYLSIEENLVGLPNTAGPPFDATNATNEQKAAELRRRGTFTEAQIQEALGSSGGGQ